MLWKRWILLWALAVSCGLAGCRITPEEIRLIETENELLRQQIQVVREKCAYYQEVKIEGEEGAEGEPAP